MVGVLGREDRRIKGDDFKLAWQMSGYGWPNGFGRRNQAAGDW